jgi:predicted nucleic acid-binding protein
VTTALAESASAEPASAEFLDANLVLRYLLGDEPTHTVRSRALIESDRSLRVSLITLTEIGYVLTRVAGVPRLDAVDAMIEFLDRENIDVHEVPTELAVEALYLCRPSGRVNFGDAALWALARATSPSRVWTFDKRFPKTGIQIQAP